jgi:hypothetical protein
MDVAGSCIYCGSKYPGGGCIYNPYGSQHVLGPDFLNRSAVQTEKASVLTYMFNMASKMITENETYKSPLDRFYKRMVSIIASVTEPLLETFCLQETPTYGKLDKKDLIKAVDLKLKFKKQLQDLSKTMTEASLELPQEIVENTLIDAIMDLDVRKNQD